VDCEKYAWVLGENCLRSMQKLLLENERSGNLELEGKLQELATAVLRAEEITVAVADAIAILWESPDIKLLYETHQNINLPTSANYFFDNARRFGDEKFWPTEEDILRAKLKTSGILETKFSVNAIEFTVVDVGGQRSERRKWLHCFTGVTAVLFLVALDEYNKTLEEDPSMNRMVESLNLFESITSSAYFEKCPIILFLNKSDVFREKIEKYPLSDVSDISPDDAKQYDKALEHIKQKYCSVFRGRSSLYPYTTCALDRDNCAKIFTSARDIFLGAALQSSGFYG